MNREEEGRDAGGKPGGGRRPPASEHMSHCHSFTIKVGDFEFDFLGEGDILHNTTKQFNRSGCD